MGCKSNAFKGKGKNMLEVISTIQENPVAATQIYEFTIWVYDSGGLSADDSQA
jgi:hypothetical protein